ncbi:MAG: DUF4249 domain-containing protein [Bacteroidales bacterium]|nr:DUF4249 domain-containing protein [Bacteroidales bacterium]
MKDTFIWKLYIALGMVVAITSCETPIDVELPEYTPKLVIEGTIENGEPAIVFLSKSLPYFSEIDLNYLLNNVAVTDAEVTVTSSDGESEQLTFQYCPDAPLYFAFVSRNLKGKENTSYTLTVKYDGQTYTARTTIPHTFDLDSAWFDNPSEYVNADTMRTIRLLLTDDPSEVNYYSFKVKVSCPKFTDRLWACTLPMAFDDKTFNGCTFNYEIERFGVSTLFMAALSEEDRREQSRISFRPGDTVYIKHSLMDYNTYRFMMTGGNEAVMGSNPFTNPAPVFSNIEGENVLGAWCGFASKIDRIVWPDTVGYYAGH